MFILNVVRVNQFRTCVFLCVYSYLCVCCVCILRIFLFSFLTMLQSFQLDVRNELTLVMKQRIEQMIVYR